MISWMKKIYRKKWPAFTLIEVMVAMFIISVGIIATIGVFVSTRGYDKFDQDLQKASDFVSRYLGSLYLSQDLSTALLSPDEQKLVMTAKSLPVILDFKITNLTPRAVVSIKRTILRKEPFIADVGLETRIEYPFQTNAGFLTRRYWTQTTLSRSYLERLK